MIEREVADLADAVVDGDARRAIAICAADPDLARAVSREAAERLTDQAAGHFSAVDPELFVWPRAQDAVVALAGVPGADASALAGELLRCCVCESVSGEADQLGLAALRLILDEHADLVERLLARSPYDVDGDVLPPWPNLGMVQTRFLADAMWLLGGEEGARWMDRLIDHDPHAIVSRRPRHWTPEDWKLRFDVLTERGELPVEAYRLQGAMLDVEDPAPRQAVPALVRFACSRFTADAEVRRSLGRAADVVAVHRSGDPARDAELFWWGASTPDQVAALRWLIELSGPAHARAEVVAAAADGGRVAAAVAAELTGDVERPRWADCDVPWVVTEVRDEQDAEAPADLAALVGAGPLRTRTVVAVHPRHGRADAAIEVVADAHATPLTWEAVEEGVWLARDADGGAARAVRDLGVLRLDLTAASPPWYLHDREPLGAEAAPEWPEVIDASYLRELAESGAPLRHQRLALREALHRRGIGEYASAVALRHVRDGIALVGAAGRPGRSVLGGPGRLPAYMRWPALTDDERWFPAPLAALVLDELPALEPLPSDGTLLIFQETETWSSDHDLLVGTRVFHVPAGVPLHEAAPPGDVVFPIEEKALRGIAVPVPGESQLVVGALEFVEDRDATIAAMNELMESWWAEHWLLGASNDIQGPSRCEVPYWLERASEETRARFAPEELDPERWTLLAQINEDADVDIAIGDGGSFYLYILEDDLRERRFDRVVGIMQCH